MSRYDGFYTMKGYELQSEGVPTSAMEDYLEMIARLAGEHGSVKAGELSKLLHVKASSVTKMVAQLSQAAYVTAERYGEIRLTEKGNALGAYLLYRHNTLHEFLCALNNTNDELEQVEKIEHYLNEQTIKNLELLTRELKAQ